MKTLWIGLIGLVVAHAGASAQPTACVESYQHIERTLDQATKDLRYDQSAGSMGYAGSAGGFLYCVSRLPTAPTAVGCGLVFGSIALVSYLHYLPAQEQIQRLEDAARISKFYALGKFGALAPDEDLKFALAELGADKIPADLFISQIVELMDSGALCDQLGRPNISGSELTTLIQQRTNN